MKIPKSLYSLNIILTTIFSLLIFSCKNEAQDRFEQLEELRIKKENQEKHKNNLIHVRFFCGDSVFTFRNIHPSLIQRSYLMGNDLETDFISDLDGNSIMLYSINYNGKIYRSKNIDIYFD